ncbi:S-adenosyl-L-methionine-dependent methyltransferase [Xylariaceae sp. FL0662B]|nr:S-adenosyl-L-methionine-dependent methyltransferase [Xylariaceae sp. FL0662B]
MASHRDDPSAHTSTGRDTASDPITAQPLARNVAEPTQTSRITPVTRTTPTERPAAPARPDTASSAAQSDAESSAPSLGAFSVGLSVDSDDSDSDSTFFNTDQLSSTISATSSVYDFVEEHGRTYHRYKEGKYWMPNDEQEQQRLDLQHMICMKVFRDQLALAPIENPGRVLDFGTGTGLWAIDFAIEHPESDVLGTDLSPIQPEFVPPNCRFEIDDIEDDWVFSHKFGYIHARHMVGSVKDFPKLFRAIYDNLNPGGWAEFQDYYVKLRSIDGTLDGTALQRWNNMLNHALSLTGRSGLAAVKYKGWFEEAGFENIKEEKFAVPGNTWAKGADQKELGFMQMENILEGIHGMSMTLFTKFLGMSAEEVELMLVDVRKDLRNRDIHFYYPMMAVYAQKPT